MILQFLRQEYLIPTYELQVSTAIEHTARNFKKSLIFLNRYLAAVQANHLLRNSLNLQLYLNG